MPAARSARTANTFVRMCVMVVAAGIVFSACSSDPDPILIGAVGDDVTINNVTSDDGTSEAATGVSTDRELSGTLSDGFSSSASALPPFTVVAHAVVDRVVAYSEPDSATRVLADLPNPTAVGGPLVFRAVHGSTDGNSEWIEVHVPIQPNGTTGWIRRADVSLSNNPYRIEIDRDGFAMRVFRQNVLWLESPVAIGTGDTPTPIGDFYLMELLAPSNPDGAYGPFAFGLSGFSEVLETFGGADTAIIGLHGTNDPASLGTNVSHGCVRIDNTVIERLANNVPLGTPVLIT